MKIYTAQQAADAIGISYGGVRYYRDRYKIGISAGPRTLYTQEDIDRIKHIRSQTTYPTGDRAKRQ